MSPRDWSSQRRETRETVVVVQPAVEPSRAGRLVLVLALLGVLLAILLSGLKPDAGAEKAAGPESMDLNDPPGRPESSGGDETRGEASAGSNAGEVSEAKRPDVPQPAQLQRRPAVSTADGPVRPLRKDIEDQDKQSGDDANETISLEEFRRLKGNY